MRPDFFIVGAPKCGTTALNDYLAQHPELFVCSNKDLHFFGSDLLRWGRPSESQYLSCFAGVRPEKRAGESSAFYLYSKRAAVEIKEFCPDASIIIMLRNPVDMLYSLHSENLYGFHEDINDFEMALEAEHDRKLGFRIPKDAKQIDAVFYRDVGSYTEQVQRYFKVFGRENVHVILYDDFNHSVPCVYRESLRFLKVDDGFQPNFDITNPNKRPRIRVFQRVLTSKRSPVFRIGMWMTPFRYRRAIRRVIQKLNTKYLPRPQMDPELRERLSAEFAPEVERLSDLLGRDLTHWSMPEGHSPSYVGSQ